MLPLAIPTVCPHCVLYAVLGVVMWWRWLLPRRGGV